MKNARMSSTPVGETVVNLLRGAVERYGSRDALLFKPAFPVPAMELFTAVERVRTGRDPSPAPGPDNGGPSHPVGTQLSPLGARFLRVYQGGSRIGPPGPSQRSRLRCKGGIQDRPEAGVHVAVSLRRTR